MPRRHFTCNVETNKPMRDGTGQSTEPRTWSIGGVHWPAESYGAGGPAMLEAELALAISEPCDFRYAESACKYEDR